MEKEEGEEDSSGTTTGLMVEVMTLFLL